MSSKLLHCSPNCLAHTLQQLQPSVTKLTPTSHILGSELHSQGKGQNEDTCKGANAEVTEN